MILDQGAAKSCVSSNTSSTKGFHGFLGLLSTTYVSILPVLEGEIKLDNTECADI